MAKKTGLILIAVFTIVISFFLYNLSNKLNQYKHVEINKSDDALGIDTVIPEEDVRKNNSLGDLVNIAFFGVDRRSADEKGRSDTIIIFTIDYNTKQIRLSSIMRDLRVPIENHGEDKINHAYSYGGPQLAIKTINQTFGTNIKDFVTVDFEGLVKIINIYGGVNVTVNDYEIPYINKLISDPSKRLVRGGKQLLNGEQAVAFSRLRYIGNGDFERTERQRKILVDLVLQSRDMGLSSFQDHLAEVLPYVETSLDRTTILSMGIKCFNEDINKLEEERFPMDGFWEDAKISGVYFLSADLNSTRKHITDFIYGNNEKSL